MMHARPLFAWLELSPARLFTGLGEMLAGWQTSVVTVTFLVLVGAHLWRQFEAERRPGIVREWYFTVLALAFVLATPVLLKTALGAMQNLKEALPEDASNETVSRRCARLAAAFPETDAVFGSQAITSEQELNPGLTGYAQGLWYDLPESEEGDPSLVELDQSDPPREAATHAGTQARANSILAAYVLTNLALHAASAMTWLAEAVRYLFLHGLALLVPLAIALLRTRYLRLTGMRLLVGFLVVLLWPALWSLGHLATGRIFDSYVTEFEGGEISAEESRYGWERIDAAFGEADEWRGGLIASEGTGVPSGWLTNVVACAFLLLAWVAFVTIGLPWLVHRLVLAGVGSVAFPREKTVW
jgi:hypothetical protein